jgi:uncharacterized protein (TIGR02147 family)
MGEPTIFEFQNFGSFLAAWLDYRKKLDRSFTHRLFAKRSGIVSHPLIAMIARGKRIPTPSTLHKLMKGLEMGELEQAYAEALVGLQKAGNDAERIHFEDRLKTLKPKDFLRPADLAAYEHMFQWYYYAIFHMAAEYGLEHDGELLATALGRRISGKLATHAVNRLIELGYLKAGLDGKLRPAGKKLQVEDGSPKIVTRMFCEAMVKQALRAMAELGEDECCARSATVALDEGSTAQAMALIERCVEDIRRLGSKSNGSGVVHQFNVQLFRLSHADAAPAKIN